jgi:hypothetical protein
MVRAFSRVALTCPLTALAVGTDNKQVIARQRVLRSAAAAGVLAAPSDECHQVLGDGGVVTHGKVLLAAARAGATTDTVGDWEGA